MTRRRDRRAAVPARPSARAARAGAADPGAEPGLAGIVPGDARAGRRRPRTGNAGLAPPLEPAARVGGFRPLASPRIESESRDVISLSLAADRRRGRCPPALPGQFVDAAAAAASRPRRRCSAATRCPGPGAGRYRISVKREPHGAASAYPARPRPAPATPLDVRAPRGTFTLRPGDAPVLLVSAGVGATPVLAMLHALAPTRVRRARCGGCTARATAPSTRSPTRRARCSRAAERARARLLQPARRRRSAGRDYDAAGHLPSAVARRSSAMPRDADAYLCGPTGFMDDVRPRWPRSGSAAARIHTEIFGARPALTPGDRGAAPGPPHPPAGAARAPARWSRSRAAASTVRWDQRLRRACSSSRRRATCRCGGRAAPASATPARRGLLSGAVAYAPEPVDEPAEGNVLICCAQPRGDIVLDL